MACREITEVQASLEEIFLAATKRSWEETLSRKPVYSDPARSTRVEYHRMRGFLALLGTRCSCYLLALQRMWRASCFY